MSLKSLNQKQKLLLLKKEAKRLEELNPIPQFGKAAAYPGAESKLQESFATCMDLGKVYFTHVVNERKSNVQHVVANKRRGMKFGMPDNLCFAAVAPYNGIAVELKVKGGSVKPKQVIEMNKLRDHGWYCCVAWNLNAAKGVVEDYLAGKL